VNFENELDVNQIVDICDAYINKLAQPIVRDSLDNIYSYAMNSMRPEALNMSREIISDRFISVAPKMYFCRIWDNEGVRLKEPKLKVTGLSMVRSTTPKYFRAKLKEVMNVLIDGDIDTVMDYSNDILESLSEQNLKDISQNSSVTSVDYTWNEDKQRYLRWTGEKFLPAPMNSRASIKHNEYITKNNIKVKEIEPGDKISYIPLKTPNPAGTDVIAFQNPKVLDDLLEYVNYKELFEKTYMSAIQLITDPIGWVLEKSDEVINDEEW